MPTKKRTPPRKPRARLSHVDEQGDVRMVDVGRKPATHREAVARGTIAIAPDALELIRARKIAKGAEFAEKSQLPMTTAQTGVEMEALTAVAAAGLTIYDMVKAVDKTMVIGDIRLIRKTGGRSGTYRRRDRS